MTPFEQLRLRAVKQRELELAQARQKYREALRRIGALSRPFLYCDTPLRPIKRRRKQGIRPVKPGTPFHLWKTVQAAHAVLLAHQPLTLVEIAIELQRRGHRVDDTPRRLLRSIREAFRYHPSEFWQDAEGRWGLVG